MTGLVRKTREDILPRKTLSNIITSFINDKDVTPPKMKK